MHVSIVYDSLKCHRDVSKKAIPLEVDNLITIKSVAILKPPAGILNTLCVKICSCKCGKFLETS